MDSDPSRLLKHCSGTHLTWAGAWGCASVTGFRVFSFSSCVSFFVSVVQHWGCGLVEGEKTNATMIRGSATVMAD